MTSTIETEDVVEARTAKSLPCPFCGATPHHGNTKVEYDQHGEPFQRFAIWCPKGHARIVAPNETSANAAWNARPDTIERLREENARLLAAGNTLAETVKMSKAALVAALTKRELDILMGDLHAWNTAALNQQ